MRIKKSQLFLILLIMIALVHGSSGRYYTYQVPIKEETQQESKTKYSDMFLRGTSAIQKAIKSSNGKITSMHTVSRRLVPGGPNPLHNWSF